MRIEEFQGYCVSANTWRDLVSNSPAPPDIKKRLINYIERYVICGSDVIDSFNLGYELGRFENQMIEEGRRHHFLDAIRDTRDLNKLPYVKIKGQPVS